MFTYSAIIIEPRIHYAFEFVLNNFLTNLSNEWGIIIFHGSKNGDFVKTILNRLLTDLEKEAIALYEFYGE
jgi:hypothetical protein